MRIIADIETDNLLSKITKIHCFSYQEDKGEGRGSITDYQELIKFLSQPDLVIVGHNFCRFDKPSLEKVLKTKFKFKVIDTLPLSWTLYPQYSLFEHSLDMWGERLGIEKPKIEDWSNLSVEEYVHRCEEDVKINVALWERQYQYLWYLYENEKDLERYCYYLSFKMDCVREQEEIGIKLDVEHCKNTLDILVKEKASKTEQLTSVMPKNPLVKKKVYKNSIRDKSGAIYTKGDLFYNFVDSDQIPGDIVVETIKGYEEPNPNSHTQIKNWLYGLGWVPQHIKHVRDKETNEVKKIPQIASKFIPGEVCDSIKTLFEKEPKLEVLNGLSIISHRIGAFEGFLEEQVDGRLYPTCSGLTNTLRLQHRTVVNLPGFDKKYGNEIRACLIADDGMELCGSDLSGIEDNTKRHYIYKYDRDYVESMNEEGYDAHIELGILAGFMTKDEGEFYKWYNSKK